MHEYFNYFLSYRFLASADYVSSSNSLDEELIADQKNNNDIIETHGDFLWLLILDLLIFVTLTFISYQASKKISESTQISEDQNGLNKLKFIKGLTYANGSKNIKIKV